MSSQPVARLLLALAIVAGCQSGEAERSWPGRWTVVLSPEAPRAMGWTADDLARYLGAMGLAAERVESTGEVRCRRDRGAVVLSGDGLPGSLLDTTAPTEQTFRIDEVRCGSGSLVVLTGGGLLGRQYAAYEWLHALGVRFFHPEEDFVPAAPSWPADMCR